MNDAGANAIRQEETITLFSNKNLTIPGHDPLVMTKFRKVAEGVVRIR